MRVFLSKREYFYFRVGPNVWCGKQHKFLIAAGGPVLASVKHVIGGLVAARSVAAARGPLAAHGWVGGPRGRLYQLFTHCFFFLASGLVAAPGIRKVYSCA